MMRKATKGNSNRFRKRRAIMIAQRIPIHDDRGQAFVELALVLPMLILLILAGVEIGRLAYADIEISNAARAGVAYAMQSHAFASDTAGIKAAAKQDAPNIPNLSVATPTLTCYCETSAGVTTAFASCDPTVANTTTCASPSVIVEYVQVNTSAAIHTVLNLPAIPSSLTLQGQAIMRVEF
jgi:Flp pilus assembly protein TadG